MAPRRRASSVAASFTPDLFAFLRDLKRHNTREWFAANKDRYVGAVEAPMLRFIAEFGERLPTISASFVANGRRVGGSLYRIHRDTRFSADKSPYKTWVAAHFRHRAARKGVAAPGFYLHLGPGECWAGGGIYHPDMPTLTRIRQHIVDDSRAWGAVVRAGLEIEGDSLKRAPAGFDAAHRFADDLRRKDFYAGTEFTERQVTSDGFGDAFVDACRGVVPLMKFLTGALDLRW
jgi:uncharacterized protein (TIGR02453 family)